MSAKQVWTVESGQYSDHKVMCVTRTKREADAIAKLYNQDSDGYRDAYVSTLPLISEPERVTTHQMQEDLYDDGTSAHYVETSRVEWEFDMLWPEYNRPVTWRWVRAPVHGGRGGRLEVFGTDQESVRRTFSDRRAQLVADDVFRRRREVKG